MGRVPRPFTRRCPTTHEANPALERLLRAEPSEREAAWGEFVEAYRGLILHVAGSFGGGHDQRMDRFTRVLDALRSDEFRRLRSFSEDGRGKFTTWLVVVVRRICLDHERRRYGRYREESVGARREAERVARRNLADLVADRSDFSRIPVGRMEDPEEQLRRRQLRAALAEVIGELTDRERLLLALRFEDDLSGREIAGIVGYPTPFHVYRRINGVLDRLRTALKEREIVDSEP